MSEDKSSKRDKSTGLLSDVDYKFGQDGSIDWRKMISSEFLVPNRDNTTETDVTKLADKDLIILLGGIKQVAQLRGFKSVKYDIVSASMDYVCMKCGITWTPNYETEGEEVYFEGTADAGLNNTSSFAQIYLAAIAENRAFCRAVRNFLRINIVAKDEIAPKNAQKQQEQRVAAATAPVASVPSAGDIMSPSNYFSSILKEKNITFEQVKTKMISEKYEGADKWNSISDINATTAFEIIARIQRKAKEAA